MTLVKQGLYHFGYGYGLAAVPDIILYLRGLEPPTHRAPFYLFFVVAGDFLITFFRLGLGTWNGQFTRFIVEKAAFYAGIHLRAPTFFA